MTVSYAIPSTDGNPVVITVTGDEAITVEGVNYGCSSDEGGARAAAARLANAVISAGDDPDEAMRRAYGVRSWLDMSDELLAGYTIVEGAPGPSQRIENTADPAVQTPRPPQRIEITGGGREVTVDGKLWWSTEVDAAPLDAEWARRIAAVASTRDPEIWLAVADALDSADQRAAHAEQVGPPVTGPVPAPPARPRVRLRTEVEVDGLPSVDLAVYVHPSAVNTATAVTTATRALHDAALAALHVLVVEPADPAGGASS